MMTLQIHPPVAGRCAAGLVRPAIEGFMEARLLGEVHRLAAGDIIVLPANMPHVFRNPGPGDPRLLGIHANPERIVHRLD